MKDVPKYWLWLVLVLAYGLQWLVSWNQPSPGYFMMTDSAKYWENAASFRTEGKIADTYMPMGASICMAVCQSLGLKEFDVVLWVHPLLNVVNAGLVFFLVRYFVSGWWPLVAACLVACYPPQMNFARQLLSEPWFVTSLLGALNLLLRRGVGCHVLAGFLLGWCVLLRSQALGIWAVVIQALILMHRSNREILMLACASVMVIALGCWIASESSGRPLFLTQQSLMMTLYRSVPGGWEDIPAAERQASYLAGLLNQPVDFITQRFWALMNMLSPWPLDGGRSWLVKSALLAFDLPWLVALGYAVIRQWRGGKMPRELWLLVVPMVGLTLFHMLFFAVSRYRMPMMVPLIPFTVVMLALKYRAGKHQNESC